MHCSRISKLSRTRSVSVFHTWSSSCWHYSPALCGFASVFVPRVGPSHPLVRSAWALAEDFCTKLPFLLEARQNLVGTTMMLLQLPVCFWYIQVVIIEYLQHIASVMAGFAGVDNAPGSVIWSRTSRGALSRSLGTGSLFHLTMPFLVSATTFACWAPSWWQ
jgi:hypothetical protein